MHKKTLPLKSLTNAAYTSTDRIRSTTAHHLLLLSLDKIDLQVLENKGSSRKKVHDNDIA